MGQRPLKEGQEDIWSTACLETIAATFGEASSHIYTFIGQVRYGVSHGDGSFDHYAEDSDAKSIQRRIEILNTLVEQIDLEIGFEAPSPTAVSTFWDDIHPSITRVAKVFWLCERAFRSRLPCGKRESPNGLGATTGFQLRGEVSTTKFPAILWPSVINAASISPPLRCHSVGSGTASRMRLAMQPDTRSIAVAHDAVIRVYDEAVSVIETHEHVGEFKEP